MTTPYRQITTFPPYSPSEEEKAVGKNAALDVVNRLIRYGGENSPFVSTGPENLTRVQAMRLLRRAKRKLDADYYAAMNEVRVTYGP